MTEQKTDLAALEAIGRKLETISLPDRQWGEELDLREAGEILKAAGAELAELRRLALEAEAELGRQGVFASNALRRRLLAAGLAGGERKGRVARYCDFCGASRSVETSHCAPPFEVRPHRWSGEHPADRRAAAEEKKGRQ